jgi:hypothetical protein
MVVVIVSYVDIGSFVDHHYLIGSKPLQFSVVFCNWISKQYYWGIQPNNKNPVDSLLLKITTYMYKNVL